MSATATLLNPSGNNWNVYKGWNGSNNVYSFLNTGRSTSGTVNTSRS